jgi:exodeoxyribonuclease VII small subunit
MSTDEAEPTFEAALDGLERIVDELERGDLDLSASLAGYEKGVALLARCQALLDGVDRSVALLTGVEADGTPVVVPFDASATAVETSSPKPPRSPVRKGAVPKPKPGPEPEIDGEIDPPF